MENLKFDFVFLGQSILKYQGIQNMENWQVVL